MARRARRSVRRWPLLLGVYTLGCSVDQRQLELAAGGSHSAAGTSSSSQTGEGGADAGETTNAGADTGAAGTRAGPEPEPTATGGSSTSPGLPPLVDGCADLDTDKIADCSVTLVKNPSFKGDVSDWAAVSTATLAWDPRNALTDAPSGCALVTATGADALDGRAPFRASQCVAVTPNQVVIAYANAIVDGPADGGASASDAGQAELEVTFFGTADCKGAPIGQFFTPPSSASSWATIQAGSLSGPAAASASVALVVFKPNRADRLSACFDNVMLKTKAP